MKTAKKLSIVSVLTPSETNVLMSDVWNLWQEIGPDLISSCREMKEKLTNECVIETLLDAQRLETKLQDECGGSSLTIERAERYALRKRALEKFRQIKYTIQCEMIEEQLGSFV